MLLYRTVDLSCIPMTAWTAAIGYLVLVFPYLWFGLNKEPADILLAYNAYYCPLICLPVVTVLRGRVKERTAMGILLGIFAINAALGWAQFITGRPLIRLESVDGAYSVPLNLFQVGGNAYMRVRAFGLFSNSMEFGYFAVIVAACGIGMCGNPANRLKGILLYLVGVSSAYSTLVRSVFLQVVICTIAALMFTFGRRPNRVKWLPLTALGIGLVLAVGGLPRSFGGSNQGLTSDASLQVRLDQWYFYATMFRHASIWRQLFGFGICQADNKVIRSIAVADNLFWGLTLHIGLVGMVLMLTLLWSLWLRMRAEAVERSTPLMIGLASFWSAFAMTGTFENAPAVFGFWYVVSILVSSRTARATIKSVPCPGRFVPQGFRPASQITVRSRSSS
jgi:hypothetical protein